VMPVISTRRGRSLEHRFRFAQRFDGVAVIECGEGRAPGV
jgi:hypothetical protein